MASNRLMFALSSRTLRHHCPQQNVTNFSRRFSDVTTSFVRPKHPVTAQERIALRAARKERAAKVLNTGGEGASGGAAGGKRSFVANKYFWYASFIVPSGILVWGFSDENSLPAQFSKFIGLTGFLQTYIDDIAKPSYEKLLPDWSQVCSINSITVTCIGCRVLH